MSAYDARLRRVTRRAWWRCQAAAMAVPPWRDAAERDAHRWAIFLARLKRWTHLNSLCRARGMRPLHEALEVQA